MRVLREPLLHFLLAGAALFGAYAWINRAAENPNVSKAPQIHIGAGDVQWLAENWTTQWRRPPTQEELRGLIARLLERTVARARSARALGLEDNDVIIRRRLAQKLTFLIDDTMRRAEPSENELQQFYEAHAQRFRSDARISFTHIYFSPERRADARSDATDALKLLLEAGAAPPTAELGDRLLIEIRIPRRNRAVHIRLFRSRLCAGGVRARDGRLERPDRVGIRPAPGARFGTAGGSVAPFSEVRARVAEEWRREQEKLAKERYLAELRKKYDIVADEAIKALIAPPAAARTRSP